MDKRTYRTGIDAAYRRSALTVLSAFPTVSTDTTVVMIPLKVTVDMEKRKHETRMLMNLSSPAQILDNAMDEWQQDWINSNKGSTGLY